MSSTSLPVLVRQIDSCGWNRLILCIPLQLFQFPFSMHRSFYVHSMRSDGYANLGIFDDQAVCLLPTLLYAKETSSYSQRQCCAGNRAFDMFLHAGAHRWSLSICAIAARRKRPGSIVGSRPESLPSCLSPLLLHDRPVAAGASMASCCRAPNAQRHTMPHHDMPGGEDGQPMWKISRPYECTTSCFTSCGSGLLLSPQQAFVSRVDGSAVGRVSQYLPRGAPLPPLIRASPPSRADHLRSCLLKWLAGWVLRLRLRLLLGWFKDHRRGVQTPNDFHTCHRESPLSPPPPLWSLAGGGCGSCADWYAIYDAVRRRGQEGGRP